LIDLARFALQPQPPTPAGQSGQTTVGEGS
jgi:hypothetical protein